MTEERAILAGGCFWGMQDLIRRYDGFLSTRVGYTGGTNSHATYRNHPGHAEAVEIIFDPARISYRRFFKMMRGDVTVTSELGKGSTFTILMTDDRDKALAAGCEDYDTKPVEFGRLPEKIERQLARSGKP